MIGDGESPHLLKWARALSAQAGVELWVASSRGFAAAFDGLVPSERRLALDTRPRSGGGNAGVLMQLPRLARWLRRVDPDWLHAHYLTSHGTLAWLAKRLYRLRARIVGSAWGSDILVAPDASPVVRKVTASVLRACMLTTSDSNHMAARMRELGAREVLTFPFGLERLPPVSDEKEPWLFLSNRSLEPLYRPDHVLRVFAAIVSALASARLIVANDGNLASELRILATSLGLRVGRLDEGAQVEFVGRLTAPVQDRCYARSTWFISLPASDSVSVSVLEAMAHGCIPLLSDLPANRELVQDGVNGLLLTEQDFDPARLCDLATRAAEVARDNRAWVAEHALFAQHALFAPAVTRFVARLREIANVA